MAQSVPATEFAVWQGASGQQYKYEVFSIDTTLKSRPGNYIYALRTAAGWQAVYIGQSDNLSRRRELSLEKEKAAINFGATHLHAHLANSDDPASRIKEMVDLVRSLHPPQNEDDAA